MTIAKHRLLTLEEYLDYDDRTDTRYELENGVLVDMSSENPLNHTIAIFLLVYFSRMGIEHYRLATGHSIQVESESASVRIPDLTVHSESSAAAILQNERILRLLDPAPMLVVEVASNSQLDKKSYERDYISKRREYAAKGIPEYWIVDAIANTVLILTLQGNKYSKEKYTGDQTLKSHSFPGLELTATQVLSAGM